MSQAWPPENKQDWLSKFRFYTPIQVRFSDTDMLGHINNVSYFSYFEHGRLSYFEELDLRRLLFNPDRGINGAIVTASLECQYLHQIHFGKEIRLGVRVSRIGNSSLEFQYALTLPAENLLGAIGRGTVVYIDIPTGKSKPIPDAAKEIIRSFEYERK
ncbi:acyl-CoA thioesterase [Lihuaxuella thermophila]|uniref:Acyl-CoA thioester hydrolase n=1 Tax=Lihuaxuella thermophila TaxID=1173111 RepID=A0A1H8AHU2_9BACL|nr:thioesterase family protein [Lihuaxuella thermophila]SEM69379.1 acyl-CoA thioester hydrolase [Lihuaxuella thermophila]